MKLIINAKTISGNNVQRTIEFEDSADLNKGVLLALYQTEGLANVIDPETGKTATGHVSLIAEKARLGAFVNEFERN